MNNIRELMDRACMQQKQLAAMCKVSGPTISDWVNNKKNPSGKNLKRLEEIFGVSSGIILGYDPVPRANQKTGYDTISIPGLLAVSPRAVPILGDIACGVPITAEQNIEGYADLPEGVRADFALRCKGDSMEPTFLDGDLVLIRQEGDVSDGRIAAVLLDSETDTEATLKRVHHVHGGLILIPDNQKKYGPRTFQGSEAAKIRILGVAVGYVRMI